MVLRTVGILAEPGRCCPCEVLEYTGHCDGVSGAGQGRHHRYTIAWLPHVLRRPTFTLQLLLALHHSLPVKSLYMCLASTAMERWNLTSSCESHCSRSYVINGELFDAKCAEEKSKTMEARFLQEPSYFEEQRK